MDTSATKLLKTRNCRGVTPARAWHLVGFWWLSNLILLLFICGCDLVKPAGRPTTAFTTTTPSGAAPAKTNSLVAAPSSHQGPQKSMAPPAGNSLVVRGTKPPPGHTTKGAEQLLATSSTAPQPRTLDSSAGPSGEKAHPATIASVVPGPTGNQLIFKGPPRPPRHPLSRAVPLPYLALGLGLLVSVLVLYSRRHRVVPVRTRKAASNDLMMPGDFKMKESAIQPDAPMGMLGPLVPTRVSLVERISFAWLMALNFLRFVQAKLSVKKPTE